MTTEIKWIKVNAGQMGYYRVLYNEDNWQNLIEELKRDHGTFTALVSHNVYTIVKWIWKKIKYFRIVLDSYQTPLPYVTPI